MVISSPYARGKKPVVLGNYRSKLCLRGKMFPVWKDGKATFELGGEKIVFKLKPGRMAGTVSTRLSSGGLE
jgi:hypothetical protein